MHRAADEQRGEGGGCGRDMGKDCAGCGDNPALQACQLIDVILSHAFIPLDNARLSRVCGSMDAQLREIEAAFDVSIRRRNESFRVEGAANHAERAVALLQSLYDRARRPLPPDGFRLALVEALARTGAHEPQPDGQAVDSEPLVLRTRRADLAGRTPNQHLYLDNIQRHDITFGIGPAGTGKTYLAVACAVDALERSTVQRIILTRPAVEAVQLALVEAAASPVAATGGEAPASDGGDGVGKGGDAPIVLRTRHADLQGRTPNQTRYLRDILGHDITFGIGPAGTGKTFLAVACAVDALERSAVQRIVLTRPAVEAGERLGFLPGDLAQKVDPYLRPLYDALDDLMGADKVVRAFEKGLLEVAPLAFMRGRTLNHAFVILDEAQNTTPEQMKMFLTRLGFGSKAVINGDVSQIDLPRGTESGLIDAERVLRRVRGVATTHFTAADVVRHPLVARIVEAYDAARLADRAGRADRDEG